MIVPKPVRVGEPEPVMLPVSWKAPMWFVARVSTVSLPAVPRSWSESKVFGDASASLIVKVPLVPAVAKVMIGLLLDKVNGEALEKVNA